MIPPEELQFSCAHSSGPGGQGVNTSNSAVCLKWDYASSQALDDAAKERFRKRFANRIGQDGVVTLEASEFRSQLQNRRAAVERLEEMIQQAKTPPRIRRKTRVPKTQKRLRREAKARRSQRLKDRDISL